MAFRAWDSSKLDMRQRTISAGISYALPSGLEDTPVPFLSASKKHFRLGLGMRPRAKGLPVVSFRPLGCEILKAV